MNAKQNPNYFEDEPLYETNLRREQETKRWDMFRDPPRKVESGSMKQTAWIDFGEKFGKVAAYIITFCVVLGCGVISKGTLLFMTSQISTDEKPYCNKDLDRNKQFTVTLPQEERVAWIWMVMFTFFAPQIGIFIRSVRKILYKSWEKPKKMEFFGTFLSESFSTIGSAMLVFVILPKLDVIKGIMLTNAFCIIPGILGLLSYVDWRAIAENHGDDENDGSSINSSTDANRDPYMHLKVVLDVVCIVAQITVLFLWPTIEDDVSLWCIPVCAILISCSWWENYVSEDSKFGFIRREAAKKRTFENNRYCVYAIVSLWKCLLFFISMLMIFWIENSSVAFLFNDFDVAFSSHPINITEVTPIIDLDVEDIVTAGPGTTIYSDHLTPVWVFIINVVSSYFCYAVAKFACKVYIQGFSFAFPLNLTVPVSVTALIAVCGIYNVDECYYKGTIPMYLFFDLPSMFSVTEFIGQQGSWIWVLWLISQAWITVHIWTPTCEKLASTERLFVRPVFEPFLVDQDIALNRRRNDKPLKVEDEPCDEDIDELINRIDHKLDDESDTMTRIYACGTMWHETKDEMMEFLKSIMRLDEDQSAKRIVKEYLQFDIPDYYEIETHVFFDDAFLRQYQEDPDPQINQFVKELVEAVDDAASEVHETRIRVRAPKKYVTPYGGRLVWTLPGRTKMIAHLKDKKKIRAKKRWSQVMYMYYLLGHKLMDRDDLSTRRKEVRAENTYILALDGDIDFQPKAVHLLVDLMKKNKSLGAACGRIHPIGSGLMVWYQMFEYAIGHWLQKATEHVIGCVLCSPGCFSLFRGKALMDDNVMKKYTTKSSEARHYVQYDQGEDRWLCTLLLQRGYRVEYAAASDAYTHCPEGFNEFYNQRRRWMPSTTANILDLLMDYKATVKVNDNISLLYILYQFVLMLGTVLGAGTIFLMLVGAFVAAFQLDQWSSFIWNIVPIAIFMLTCALFSNDKIQLFVAGILSAMYSLIMMAVLVGVILQISSDGFFAPSSLFFFFVAMEMIIAGLIHPKEFNCLPFGVVYYVTVPSMYMLLVIYSVFNMNNVSWGTREVTVVMKPNPNASPEEVKKDTEKPKPKNNLLSFFGVNENDNKGAFEFSLANFFKCMLCTHRDEKEDENLKQINAKVDKLIQKLEKLENMADPSLEDTPARRRTTMVSGLKMEPQRQYMTDTPSVTGSLVSEEVAENTWIDDEVLQRGEVDCITGNEYEFWNGLLDKYLHPIDDTNEKKRIQENLKDLRDKSVMAFFMINALFVLVVFLLTLKKEMIHLNWPLEVKVNFTYMDDDSGIIIYKEYLQLEPIGIVFVFAFAILLVVQFIAMFIHRFETFSQIISNTALSFNLFTTKTEDLTQDEILEMNSVEFIKKLQKLKGVDSDSEDENKEEEQPGRRKTIHKLTKSSRKHHAATSDLEKAFQRRIGKYKTNDKYAGPVRRETIMAMDSRKSRLARASHAHLMRPNFGSNGTANLGFVEEEITV